MRECRNGRAPRPSAVTPVANYSSSGHRRHLVADCRTCRGIAMLRGRRPGRSTRAESSPRTIQSSNARPRPIPAPAIVRWKRSVAAPDAQLIIYSDSGDRSQFQYPDLFVAHTRTSSIADRVGGADRGALSTFIGLSEGDGCRVEQVSPQVASNGRLARRPRLRDVPCPAQPNVLLTAPPFHRPGRLPFPAFPPARREVLTRGG
jgi:hypothetical protein